MVIGGKARFLIFQPRRQNPRQKTPTEDTSFISIAVATQQVLAARQDYITPSDNVSAPLNLSAGRQRTDEQRI